MKKEVILTGDLNCNYLIPNDHKTIKDILSINGLKQVIDQPTRSSHTSKSLIDIIATTHESRIANRTVHASSLRDHNLIGIIRKFHCKKFAPRKIWCRNYKNINANEYRIDLRDQSRADVLKISNLNTAWNKLKDLLMTVIHKHTPLKK